MFYRGLLFDIAKRRDETDSAFGREGKITAPLRCRFAEHSQSGPGRELCPKSAALFLEFDQFSDKDNRFFMRQAGIDRRMHGVNPTVFW